MNDTNKRPLNTALKARYKLYGIMLKYFLWMRKLPAQQQFMVVLAQGKSN